MRPMVWETSCAADSARKAVDCLFDCHAERRWFATGRRGVKADNRVKYYAQILEKYLAKPFAKGGGRVWTFDYITFLKEYFLQKREREDDGEVLRVTLAGAIESGHSYLENDEMEKMPLNGIADDKILFEKWLAEPEVELDEDMSMVEHSVVFFAWLEGSKDEAWNFSEIFSSRCMPRIEERVFLYGMGVGKSVYERTEEERTLRRIETERRVALEEMVKFGLDERNIGEQIEEKIGDTYKKTHAHAKKIRRFEEIVARETEHAGYPVFLRNIIEFERKTKKRCEYTFLVLKLHRDWLEKVLSR